MIDMLSAATTVKNFIKFLFEMEICIEKVLAKEYSVEVFNSLDYMEEWSFISHVFELCDHGNLKKIPNIEQSVVVTLTSKNCCSTTMVKIYTLWERIFHGFEITTIF